MRGPKRCLIQPQHRIGYAFAPPKTWKRPATRFEEARAFGKRGEWNAQSRMVEAAEPVADSKTHSSPSAAQPLGNCNCTRNHERVTQEDVKN